MNVQDKVLSKTLKIKNGKLLRNIENVSEIENIIEVLSKFDYLNKFVINASFYSKEGKIIEHDIIKYIIHSGEYTESMAYDVNRQSLEMAINLAKYGVYSYDLLPHNFTFYEGNWLLYDFDSFRLSPKKSTTQIKGFFKINFSNFEILRLVDRKSLGYYYLTRYRIEDILHIIPFHRWLYLFLNHTVCNVLYTFRLYKLCYSYLKMLFKYYTKNYKKNYYNYVQNDAHSLLDTIICENDISSVFCVGEESARFAIYSEKNSRKINKLVYIDDYKSCDEYYNYIVQSGYKNIIPAVLYPLIDDEEIPFNYTYRALYDSYAQERFYSDCVCALNLTDFDKKELLKNLTAFTSNMLILSLEDYSQEDISYLKKLFKDVSVINDLYIVAKEKISKEVPIANKFYSDGNRGPDARRQSNLVKELVKSKK